MTKFWKGKKIMVTGNMGMIGKELVIQLKELGAITIGFDKAESGWDVTKTEDVEFIFESLEKEGFLPDFIFHLFGVKGNPKKTKEQPVDFLGPMLQGDTNMILIAQKYGIKRFLYTSSIAVDFPETDWYPAWAKRTAEELIKAMRVQYPNGTKYTIVRPANVYGRYDNFDNPSPMVVTKLIKEGMTNKRIILDNKGSQQVREIINAKDVARGMIKAMEELPKEPVNLTSGYEITIKQLANIIAQELDIPIEYKDLDITLGPDRKVMGNPYITPKVPIRIGIREVIMSLREKP